MLAVGLSLPVPIELLGKLPVAGAYEGSPPESGAYDGCPPRSELATGLGLAGGGCTAALVGAGAGTDEVCDACEACEAWLPEPETWDECDEWLT